MAQTLKLPLSSFEWVQEKEVKAINWATVDTEGDVGYIVEVDLSYPTQLHSTHADYPLAPETMHITETNLSPVSKRLLLTCNGKEKHATKKLTSTFLPKKRYVVHFKMLQFYLEMGLKLEKVRRVLSFKQAAFLAPYINETARLRTSFTNLFWKKCMKLLSNSVYGKMLQSGRHYTKIVLCQTAETAGKAISSPFYTGFRIYSSTFVACFLKQDTVNMKEPKQVGLSILDLSKLHMYKIYYKCLLPTLRKHNFRLLGTDTDSFILAFSGMSLSTFYQKVAPIMDFSNYPVTHERYDTARKGQLGFLKDELCGNAIAAAACIRSKCYSLLLDAGQQINRCKGVPRRQTNSISFSEYKNVILGAQTSETSISRGTVFRIQSRNHDVSTVTQKRLFFTAFDDKRYYLCAMHSIPYGDCRIAQFQNRGCFMCT